MSLRTVIVDDEPLALELLCLLLAEHEDIEVVAECQNGREALSHLQSKPVDLLFLDVQMPKVSGFDVVEQIGLRHLPPTIFVTAYHEYAVRAFDVHAVDYLTKPINTERLATALDRVREKIAAKTAQMTQEQLTAVLNGLRNTTEQTTPYLSRFLVKDGVKEILLPVEKIDWIEAAEYYCCLHTNEHRYMVRETVTDLSGKLDPNLFVRIHRSSIVNLNQIREIYREGPLGGSIVLKNGKTLRMSRAGRQKLNEIGRISG
jgi:two-component system, LytTR family, response regulator